MKRAGLAAIGFCGCLGLGYLALSQRAERVRLDLDLSASSQMDQKRISALQEELVAALAGSGAARPVPGSSPATPTDPASRTVRMSDIIKAHPEYAAIRAKEGRRAVLALYGDGLAMLNLAPDQLAKLKRLLVERELSARDARQAAEANGLDPESEAGLAAERQATDGMDREMTALLGTDSGPVLRQIQAQRIILTQIQNTYAVDFDYANVPLAPEETHGLALAVATATNSSSVSDHTPNPVTGLSLYDERMLTAAAEILNPAQLQILKTDQILDNQQSAIMAQYHPMMLFHTLGRRDIDDP